MRSTDFKTGAFDEAHKFQVRVYAVLWRLDDELNPSGRVVDRLVLAYDDKDVDVPPPSALEIDELGRELIARRQTCETALAARPPAARPGAETCRYCGVRQLCDAYWAGTTQAVSDDRRFGDVELKIIGRHGPTSWDAVVVRARDLPANTPALLRLQQPGVRAGLTIARARRRVGARPRTRPSHRRHAWLLQRGVPSTDGQRPRLPAGRQRRQISDAGLPNHQRERPGTFAKCRHRFSRRVCCLTWRDRLGSRWRPLASAGLRDHSARRSSVVEHVAAFPSPPVRGRAASAISPALPRRSARMHLKVQSVLEHRRRDEVLKRAPHRRPERASVDRERPDARVHRRTSRRGRGRTTCGSGGRYQRTTASVARTYLGHGARMHRSQYGSAKSSCCSDGRGAVTRAPWQIG